MELELCDFNLQFSVFQLAKLGIALCFGGAPGALVLQIGKAAGVQIVAAVSAQANDGLLVPCAVKPNERNNRRSRRRGFGHWDIQAQ